jgi:hypothetical protein
MLSGKSNSGKTTTLNLVYDYIIHAHGTVISPKRMLGDTAYLDFECVLGYKNKTVAIFSMGDLSGDVCGAFIKYNGQCDVLICACNTRLVYPYQQIKHYPNDIIAKTMPRNVVSNITDRDKILALI